MMGSEVSLLDTVLPEDTPVYGDKVRFVCVSDTHNRIPLHVNVPDGDVLLHAGDFTNFGMPNEVESFNNWLGTLPHKQKIVIAGNHELSFSKDKLEEEEQPTCSKFGFNVSFYLKRKGISHMKEVLTNCTYLEDSETSVYGIRIYGTSWQTCFCPWKSENPAETCMDKWNMIPEGIDILMTHGPPYGYGDACRNSTSRAGCSDLVNTIQKRVKCKYHVFGHIHEAHGVSTDGHTVFINAATCNTHYLPCQRPFIFDIPLPPGVTKEEVTSGNLAMAPPSAPTTLSEKEKDEI